MAEEKIQPKATDAELKRSLTGSAALDMAMAFAGGAGAAAGKVAVEQIAQHVTNRPKDPPPPKIELPTGYKKEE